MWVSGGIRTGPPSFPVPQQEPPMGNRERGRAGVSSGGNQRYLGATTMII